jgi:hypothetical protein
VVAYGSAQPADQGTVHLRPLRPQHCSVGINSVTTGFEDILIPVPIEEEEFTTLWAAKGSFVQWPCAWVRLMDQVIKILGSFGTLCPVVFTRVRWICLF